MAKAKPVKIANRLLWKTCLVVWQNNYLETKTRQHTTHQKVFLGIGVMVGVGQDDLVLALSMMRMRDFGNSSFSGTNEVRGTEFSKIIIPRKKSGRISKNRPSVSCVDACYQENENSSVFPEVIQATPWLPDQDKKSILASLPLFHSLCKEYARRERSR